MSVNRWLYLICTVALLFLTSCIAASTSASNPIEEADNDTPVALLFSDADNPEKEQETIYYDALIELTSSHPDEMPQLVIVDSSEQDKIQYFDIDQFPTILCLDGDDVSLRIEGTNKKEEILMLLSNLLELNLKLGQV